MNRIFWLCITLFFTALATPQAQKKQNPETPSAQGTWRITQLHFTHSRRKNIEFQGQYLLELQTQKASLQLTKNRCQNKIEYRNDSLLFQNAWSCTKMCCDEPETQSLREYLTGPFSIQIQDNEQLILKTKKHTFLLQKVASPQPETQENTPPSLYQTTWRLDAFEKEGMKSHLDPNGPQYKLHFSDNLLQLQLDANTCTSTFTLLPNNKLLLSNPLVCTQKCCESTFSSTEVRPFFQNLELQFSIDNQELLLKSESQTLHFKLQAD